MQHPLPSLFAGLEQARVEPGVAPAFDHLGFPFGQVSPHWEVGFGERERRFVVGLCHRLNGGRRD